jgi:GT2 family glycosyltransferase
MSTLAPKISVSIVIHQQAAMVKALLEDLNRLCQTYPLEVILTLNLPEALGFGLGDYRFPVVLQENAVPKGFSANHNQAFSLASGDFFCVMNPDIRLGADPFSALIACLDNTAIGVVAPLVLNSDGAVEDSARRFPTPFKIVCKALGGCKGNDYPTSNQQLFPDWVGGMFLLFSRSVFAQLHGFDSRYFLYYEDVDICARLRLLGYQVMLSPQAIVIHHAQRSSHRKFKYLYWHLKSMVRFFLSSVFRQVQWRKVLKELP